jgi:uncharacterized protein
MKFTRETAVGANLVRGWSAGSLRINQQSYSTSVVVAADALVEVALVEGDTLDEGALAPALELEPEILLVGTGSTRRAALPAVVVELARRGIGIEVMDTVAAARTYNVLVGEGRRVVALLIVPDA